MIKTDKVIAAIDPGISGGIAIEGVGCYEMPTFKIETKPAVRTLLLDAKGKKQFYKSGSKKGEPMYKIKTPAKYKEKIDTKKIFNILNFHKVTTLVLEEASFSVGNAAKSTRTTSENWGRLAAIAELLDMQLITVTPNKWKKDLKLPKEKEATEKLMLEKTSNISFRTEKGALLDGKADACAILYWYVQFKCQEN